MLNGSLAVWCDIASQQVVGLEPRLDLHFNMWLDLPRAAYDVLDIGILLKESRQIEQLKVYFPAELSLKDFEDLSPILRDASTLSAVFNSTYSVGEDCVLANGQTLGYTVKDSDGRVTFSVVTAEPGKDFFVDKVPDDQGTIVRFTKALFQSINEDGGTHYLRLRLKLVGRLKELFRDASTPNDSFLLSGFHSSDVIEFRVNERRNFGVALRNMKMNFPRIDTIHYFLLRDIKTELVQSHADFKKMRRLEPKLWERYLQGLGTNSPEKWVAYHWKTEGDTKSGVEDFIALAFFSKPRYRLHIYVAAIILLGAAGSAGQAGLNIWYKSYAGLKEDTVETQVRIIGLALGLIVTMYLFVNWRSIWTKFQRFSFSSLCGRIKHG